MSFATSFVGAPVVHKQSLRVRPSRTVVAASADVSGRRQALGFAALSAALLLSPAARADLTTDLLAKSSANKATNDAKRLATSGANFARSRTVTDGTCEFPNNWVGCENAAETGSVKFLSDDLALECQGVPDDKICPAKAAGSFPSPFGL